MTQSMDVAAALKHNQGALPHRIEMGDMKGRKVQHIKEECYTECFVCCWPCISCFQKLLGYEVVN